MFSRKFVNERPDNCTWCGTHVGQNASVCSNCNAYRDFYQNWSMRWNLTYLPWISCTIGAIGGALFWPLGMVTKGQGYLIIFFAIIAVVFAPLALWVNRRATWEHCFARARESARIPRF